MVILRSNASANFAEARARTSALKAVAADKRMA
jgi:hypothetical protein